MQQKKNGFSHSDLHTGSDSFAYVVSQIYTTSRILTKSYTHVHIGPSNYTQSILRRVHHLSPFLNGLSACIVCCVRSAANFYPCCFLIFASHNCPLIRFNRFFALDIDFFFPFLKTLAFLALRCSLTLYPIHHTNWG